MASEMPNDADADAIARALAVAPRSVKTVRRKRNLRRWWPMVLVLVAVPAALWAAGIRPEGLLYPKKDQGPALYEIDQGDLQTTVVESGSLESSENATVRCQVEALIGMVGGSATTGNMRQSSSSASSGGTRASAPTTNTTTGTRTSQAGAAKASTGSGSSSSQNPAVTVTSGSMVSGSGSSLITAKATKPTVTSFNFTVAQHIPLRPTTTTAATTTKNQAAGGQQGQQQQATAGVDPNERPGATRIIRILDEGTHVEEGEVVCWLDDSAFRDELDAQMIRWAQAKSWVEQAEKILEVSNIALREYRDGVYSQDVRLVTDYIEVCKIQEKQAQDDFAWSNEMLKRNLYSEAQVKRSEYALEQARVAMREGREMEKRLIKFTGPKNIANLEAKIAAVQADLQAQRAAYEKEDQRKRRLEKAIANCQMRAPRAGSVVYYTASGGWGRTDQQIHEGITVRENQPIFSIPDPNRMRVRAKVNEAKVAYIESGLPVLIKLDAIPDCLLHGRVAEITVIPQPANGPFSDVKVYFANVEILDPIAKMNSGMTAHVEILVGERKGVTRIPINAVRWFDDIAFTAVPASEGKHTWKPIVLGVMNDQFAEVRLGLKPGDRVIGDPSGLTPPTVQERREAKVADIAASPAPAKG
jgi:multidrug resistance efflux pump